MQPLAGAALSSLASHQRGIRFSVKAFELDFSCCSIERSPVEHIINSGGSVHLQDSLLCDVSEGGIFG